MLLSLSIENFILIEKAYIEFSDGFSVMTGETGAGKSIILDALQIVLGEKANAKILRNPDLQSTLIAEFSILGNDKIKALMDESGLLVDDTILIRRVISKDGKSKVFINDNLVTIGVLQQISNYLLEIFGQNQHHSMLSPSMHRDVLDAYLKNCFLRDQVSTSYKEWQILHEKLLEMKSMQSRSNSEQEYLQHVVSELESFNYLPNEENKLDEERQRLIGYEKCKDILKEAMELLESNGAAYILHKLQKALGKKSDVFQEAMSAIDRALLEIEEAESQIRSFSLGIDEESDLISIENRFFAIKSICKKYGIRSEEISEFLESSRCKLEELSNIDDSIEEVQRLLDQKKDTYYSFANQISKARKEGAKSLENAVTKELKELHMAGAGFFIKIQESEPSQYGLDKIYFEVLTNHDSKADALQNIASGGEISRIMLALKVALADVKGIDTIIFDEIDAGIGGVVAGSVGKKLSVLGDAIQILAITHQAQIAAQAKHQYHVNKELVNGLTKVSVTTLSGEKRVDEIARMLTGGSASTEARAAAVALLSG